MRIRFQLVVFMVLRTVLNTAHRMVYPFLSIFARGLGVELSTMSLLMTVRSMVGITSPFFAPISDRRGRKFGMITGVLIFTFAVTLVTIHPSFWSLSAALVIALIGKYIFDPSMQAYLGDRVPYDQRGSALAVTEVAWSMSFIVGVPVIGFLIDRYGWPAPFPVFTVAGLVILFILWRMVPREDSHHEPILDSRIGFRAVLSSIPALAGMSIAMWASAGNELVNLIFGVWLEDSFGLKIAALAGASAVIGLSELSGEGFAAFTTDRLGKPLALSIGLVGNALAAILLPLIGRTEFGALVGLFFFYITFEYVLVSHIPLMTELVPGARATMMSVNVMGHSVGRAIGALLATLIYQRFGFSFVAFTAVVFNAAALMALRRMQKG